MKWDCKSPLSRPLTLHACIGKYFCWDRQFQSNIIIISYIGVEGGGGGGGTGACQGSSSNHSHRPVFTNHLVWDIFLYTPLR